MEQPNSEQQPLPAAPNEGTGKKKSDMKLRIATGIVYVAVLVGFYLLKILVSDYLFDPLVLLFAMVGTFEMVRALKSHTTAAQRVLIMVFVALVIITYSVSDYIFREVLGRDLENGGSNYTPLITFVVFIAGLAILLGLLVFQHEGVSLDSTGCSLLAYVYPSVFLIVLIGINHLEWYSDVAILFVFVICPFADSLALVFGKLLGKKLPAKMAPHISPNKTLIGGFGGLVGGALGAVVVFFVYYGLCKPVAAQDFSNIVFEWEEMIFFLGIGVIAALFSQFGDLVESAIKRKLAIKDMGKILPGHGGILDRIDSSLYASLVICLIFTLRIMIMV